jgi:hypothetical protein
LFRIFSLQVESAARQRTEERAQANAPTSIVPAIQS